MFVVGVADLEGLSELEGLPELVDTFESLPFRLEIEITITLFHSGMNFIPISSPSTLFFDICEISITADFLQGTLVPNTYRNRRIRNSSQHIPQKTYFTNQVPNTYRIWRIAKHPVPNLFYELKYDFPVYEQFFYDALVHTMLPCTISSHTIFSAPTNFNYE